MVAGCLGSWESASIPPWITRGIQWGRRQTGEAPAPHSFTFQCDDLGAELGGAEQLATHEGVTPGGGEGSKVTLSSLSFKVFINKLIMIPNLGLAHIVSQEAPP